jgi:asparagine synthase (glutamine-hydrolysing)
VNLFIAAWNLSEHDRQKALAAIPGMGGVYPQLDLGTMWGVSSGKAWAGGVHDRAGGSLKRQYVFQSEQEVLFFDGCPVDRTGRFWALDAPALAANWNSLTGSLEGQFVVMRVGRESSGLDLITDFLGMSQVYYRHEGGAWWISNSVELISRAAGVTGVDPLGVSLALSLGWAGADRTLMRDVRVIPPGSCWTWREPGEQPSARQYFLPRHLARSSRRQQFTGIDAIKLREELTGMCRILSRFSGFLSCPVTGGRDSRVLVSLMRHGSIRGQYYTDGEAESNEVKISQRIAEQLGLQHTTAPKDVREIVEGWDEVSGRVIRQNDGMVSLWQVADLWKPSSSQGSVGLWGIGGEIARGNYSNPRLFVGRKGVGDIKRFLSRRVLDGHGGLVRMEAFLAARDYLESWVDEMSGEGFAPVDIPDLFYTYERIRRWAGSNARKILPVHDLFSPFCTRAFVGEAFRLQAAYRYSEPLHYQLLALDPVLHAIPFLKEPWRPQCPAVNMLSAVWRRRLRLGGRKKAVGSASIQESLMRNRWCHFREFCLDQESSPLWGFIDRGRFEAVMRGQPDIGLCQDKGLPLFQIFTLFYYARNFRS